MKKKRFLILLCITTFCYGKIVAQQNDSIPLVQTSQKLMQLCDTAFLFKHDTINELWFKDQSFDTWKLNEFTEVFTYDNNNLRIWKQGNSLSLWFYARQIDDWQVYDNINSEPIKINDTINYINIDDTTALLSVNKSNIICYKNNEIFLWNNDVGQKKYQINDTIKLSMVNDTVAFWKYSDSTMLWNLKTQHTYWQITNFTKVWTISEDTEFWKAGENYKVWRKESPSEKWKQDDSIKAKLLDSLLLKHYWNIDEKTLIFTDKDSTQIWEANINKPIWNFRDSIHIWEINLPKIDTISKDTIVEEIVREVKRAELFTVDENVKLWGINDSVKLCTSKDWSEIWHANKKAKLWKLNDSTLVWNINHKVKLSIISNKIAMWRKNDTSFVWEVDSGMQQMRINEDFIILKINDSTRCTIIEDSTNVWRVASPTKVSALSSVNYLILNDTIEIWEPNDSTKLCISTYGEQGNIWTRNKRVNILNINDSTKIWQINKNIRLSIVKNKLKLWQQGRGDPYLSWKESKGFEQDIINDSIRLWHINKSTVIWETKHIIQVWNKNKDKKLYRLNDTSLVWTYNASIVPKTPSKISYWKFSGSVKMDLAQMWADNWAKGAQNNITSLFILNCRAKYKKKKINWTSDLTYHYGFIKSGDEELRKNEDKIKISSIFNYYAIKKFYYSFSLTTQTQFFEGYKHKKDTSYLVSDWAAPLYHTMAIGLNYYPVEQLSIFFSPLTNRTTYVKDTSIINQTYYGIDSDKNFKNEPGIIFKSNLNWNISGNINLTSKLDIFSSYKDIKTQNIEWETSLTFKFNNFVSTRLNANLIYDPDIHIKDDNGKEFTPIQFKELISIGVFYKI